MDQQAVDQKVERFVPQSEVYNVPRRPAWQFHMAGGAIVGVMLFVIAALTARFGIGVFLLSLGVLYAAAAWILGSLIQGDAKRPAA